MFALLNILRFYAFSSIYERRGIKETIKSSINLQGSCPLFKKINPIYSQPCAQDLLPF